jgi:hypothetical protein
MLNHVIGHAKVNARRSAPHFDRVSSGSQTLCATNRGMVSDMGAGIDVRRLDAIADDPDFVSVHGKFISNGQIPKFNLGLARLK